MKFKPMRFILFFLMLLSLFSANSQTPAYLHYGVKDGLPSNLVYCGLQDHNGLLWFGTDKGLACFDGSRFHTYGVKDGLPDPEVLMLFEDSKHRIWMCCFRHKPCYFMDGVIYTAKQDTLLDKISFSTSAFDMSEDTCDHSLWLAGLSYELYRIKDNQLTAYYLQAPMIKAGRVNSNVYAFSMGEMFKLGQDNLSWTSTDNLTRFFVNHKRTDFVGMGQWGNHILYAYADGLMAVKLENDRFQLVDQNREYVGRVFLDRNGRYWICSFGSGAICFDNNNSDLSNPVTYLKGNKVNNMFEDRQGTLWFCTSNNGILALPKNAALNFTKEYGFRSNNITSLAKNPHGGVFAGDDEGNFYEISTKNIKITGFGSFDGYNRVRQIVVDPVKNGQWIGSDESLYFRSADKSTKIDSVPGNVKALLEEKDKLWFATSKTVGFVKVRDFSAVKYENRRFTSIGQDSEGYVWAGSVSGLYNSRDNFKNVVGGDSILLLKSRIITILNAGNGFLWVVTPESGLIRVQVKDGFVLGVEVINNYLSHPIFNVQSIYLEPAPESRLWLATNTGVYGITPGSWFVTHFDAQDGLADDDVNTVLVWKDTLWAGTVNGLTRLIIKPIGANRNFASLFCGARYHLQREIIETNYVNRPFYPKKLVVPADATLVELDLSGLDFRSNGNLRYECIQTQHLLPAIYITPGNIWDWVSGKFGKHRDSSWIQDKKLNFGVNLPAGRYHFRLTAVNAGDEYSNKPDFLELIRLPYWYQTIWFWLCIWSLVGLGLYRIYKARVAFRELNAAASELQLQALRAQMNPHFVGNSINAIQQFFYPPDPVRASDYIALFTRLLRQTMLFSEQSFVTFGEELAYNEDYLQMIQLRFSDRFQFHIDNAEQIRNDTPFPAMILQPILENATIHGLAPGGVSILNIRFDVQDNVLTCTVKDNGVGYIEMQNRKMRSGTERKSKGLELLQKKIQTLNRLYNIGLSFEIKDRSMVDTAEHGTIVTLNYRIPNFSQSLFGKSGIITPGIINYPTRPTR